MKIGLASVLVAFGVVISAGGAKAYTPQDQMACMNDALTVCSQYIPDRGRVAACLFSNRNRISVACRSALDRNHAASVSQARLTTER